MKSKKGERVSVMDVPSAESGGPAFSEGGVTLGEQAYRRLKELILTGSLRPEERLAEAQMAERLGVSRTPLRQALSRLAQEKLIARRSRSGYVVADLDAPTVRDLVGLREALDVYAARVAALVATEADIARMRTCLGHLEEVVRCPNPKEQQIAVELDMGLRIHVIIAESTGNIALLDTVKQVYQRLQLAIWMEVLWVDQGARRLAEHREIVAAICAHDPERSAQAARSHVQRTLQNMLRVLETRERMVNRQNDAKLGFQNPYLHSS